MSETWESEVLAEPLAQATGCKSCGGKPWMAAFGGKVTDARLERIHSSPHFNGKRFRNALATALGKPSLGLAWEYVRGGSEREPAKPIPIVRPPQGTLASGKGEPLRITWMGHSTMLIEIDGALVLTDPVFGPRAAPVSWAGPKRFHEVPIEPEQLPPLDAIIVSHDHYDHLDFLSVSRLAHRETMWVTSLGVGAHLESWGVPPEHIVELDWWEHTEVAGLEITAAPARHFQGRGPSASSATFWSSFAIRGPKHSVWFSGDTGPHDEGFSEIGRRLGPFDVSMIEIGAWHPAWGTIHLGPENALAVHHQVRAKTFMPVHWGTFNLALHAWDQPIRHLLDLADKASAQLLSPMMGQTVHREAGVADYWKTRR